MSTLCRFILYTTRRIRYPGFTCTNLPTRKGYFYSNPGLKQTCSSFDFFHVWSMVSFSGLWDFPLGYYRQNFFSNVQSGLFIKYKMMNTNIEDTCVCTNIHDFRGKFPHFKTFFSFKYYYCHFFVRESWRLVPTCQELYERI